MPWISHVKSSPFILESEIILGKKIKIKIKNASRCISHPCILENGFFSGLKKSGIIQFLIMQWHFYLLKFFRTKIFLHYKRPNTLLFKKTGEYPNTVFCVGGILEEEKMVNNVLIEKKWEEKSRFSLAF
jgi:hypothetical protein